MSYGQGVKTQASILPEQQVAISLDGGLTQKGWGVIATLKKIKREFSNLGATLLQ